MIFTDRTEAGRQLGGALSSYRGRDVLVLGLPRGGVPVAFEVARALDAPLDVLVVRKLGLPDQPELAFGALGEGGVEVLNDDVVRAAGLTATEIASIEAVEHGRLETRVRRLRDGGSPASLASHTVIVVDDGIATGATARAACRVARARGAARVVLAIPVASPRAAARLRNDVDDLVCLDRPGWLGAVAEAYRHFGQVTDAEVADLLRRAPDRASKAAATRA